MTQDGLAAVIGSSRPTLSRLERGQVVASAVVLASLEATGYELIAVPRGASITIGPKKWQTGAVRIYLPASPTELEPTGTNWPLASHQAYAVTPELVIELGEDDREVTEFAAFSAAAEACLGLMAAGRPQRRVVISAEVEGTEPATDPDAHPAQVTLVKPVTWANVVAMHIDEPAALPDIAAAQCGDAIAADRLAERDLLWYDPSERSSEPLKQVCQE